MQTTRKLVLNRETVRLVGVVEKTQTNSANNSCWQTLCTTESGCQLAAK